MSTCSPWDYGADVDPSPERVCIIAFGRAIIVPMIGAAEKAFRDDEEET